MGEVTSKKTKKGQKWGANAGNAGGRIQETLPVCGPSLISLIFFTCSDTFHVLNNSTSSAAVNTPEPSCG